MILEVFRPAEELAPFIELYLVFEDEGTLANLPLNIVPNGLPEIAVHYGDHCESHLNRPGEVEGGYLYGPHTGPGYFMARGRIKCLCVLFKPFGAYRIFGIPQVEMRNYAINLDALCGAEGGDFIERVNLASSPGQRAVIADWFFIGQLRKSKERPPVVEDALDLILRSRGSIKIRDLCSRLDINIKTLERGFKHALGLTPKEFASIIRVNDAYRLMKSNPRGDIQEVVFKCGYYDQAHLINDFRSFTRLTPDLLRKDPDSHVIYLNRLYTH